MVVTEIPFVVTVNDMDRAAFGLRLRELRLAAGLTQQAAADALGQPQPNIARWETAVMEPPVTLLPSIVSLYGVTLDQLFAEPPTKKAKRRKTNEGD